MDEKHDVHKTTIQIVKYLAQCGLLDSKLFSFFSKIIESKIYLLLDLEKLVIDEIPTDPKKSIKINLNIKKWAEDLKDIRVYCS